jgi:hypothetical protein
MLEDIKEVIGGFIANTRGTMLMKVKYYMLY